MLVIAAFTAGVVRSFCTVLREKMCDSIKSMVLTLWFGILFIFSTTKSAISLYSTLCIAYTESVALENEILLQIYIHCSSNFLISNLT